MADPVETSINRMVGDKFCSVYTGEKKFVEELRHYAKEYPNDMSEEQRQAAAERLAKAKEQKKLKENET